MSNGVSNAGLVEKSYDIMANDYDNINGEAFYANQYEVYERHLAKYLVSTYRCSLDLGCGTGIQTIKLATRSEYCVGVDLSQNLLSKAKQKSNFLQNIDYVRCDIEYIPFRDEVFDCVISYGEVISHLREYARTFEEMSRISQKGTLLILSVLNKWNLGLLYSPKELQTDSENKVRAGQKMEY